ncbi:MAG: peptide chain release factor N(5)-glutamine methyltransferase [Myxococcaceae bacterium]|nr:peptide chain release factor N(5)-glutamine methyltransferase [Myxococcaceae bacterium]
MSETQEPWTIRRVLSWTTQHFEKQAIDSARLSAELLLAHTLKVERVKLYMELDRPLQKDELATYKGLVTRRLGGEPTQYLLGHKDFYNRRFAVDSRVLIPRAETELLVAEVLKRLPTDAPSRVLDLCTGSGCIAVTIAAQLPTTSVWAVDISAEACAVARDNAQTHQVDGRVTVMQGNLWEPLPPEARFDVIVSNPPYIASASIPTLQREVQQEPKLALDGGADGLTLIARIVDGAGERLKPGATLALEIGDEQGPAVADLLTRAGYHEVRVEKDWARFDRLAFGRKGQ